MTRSDASDALGDLFDLERDLILKGRIADLPRISQDKTSLMEDLRQHGSGGLEDLIGRAQRNQLLLDAAAQGLRSAINRVHEIRRNAGKLETYSADGSRTDHITGHGALERRAVELDASHAPGQTALGLVYMSEEAWEKGIPPFTQAISLDPKYDT